MSEKEKTDILNKQIDEAQMDDVTGGGVFTNRSKWDNCMAVQQSACVNNHYRTKSNSGCAATVEKGSFCSSNDACVMDAVEYDRFIRSGKQA